MHQMMMMAYGPAAGGDPNFSSVTSLLHFDGADGSTTFTDVKGKTWAAGGSAQLDTAQAKWGSAALLLDGSGAYISTGGSADYSPIGDFTLDAWIRPAAIGSIGVIASTRGSGTGWQCQVNADGTILVGFWGSWSGSFFGLTSTTVLSANTYYHVRWCKSGGTYYLFVDGNLEASGTPAGDYASNTATLYLGYDPQFGGRYFNGHIDDFRITNGVARSTASFTPPTAAFPDS